MKKLSLVFILSIGALASAWTTHGAEIYSKGVPLTESFDSFQGTCASLPHGFSISKDGSSPMISSDADYRGVKTNSVTTGGCYAWMTSTNDISLGCQPTADDFSPGWFMLTVTNLTGSAASEVTVSFDILCRNNADRSSAINLETAGENGLFKTDPTLSFTSGMAAGPDLDWSIYHRSARIRLPEPVSHSKSFFIRWRITDAGGSGSRDELGINNLSVIINKPRGTSIHISRTLMFAERRPTISRL